VREEVGGRESRVRIQKRGKEQVIKYFHFFNSLSLSHHHHHPRRASGTPPSRGTARTSPRAWLPLASLPAIRNRVRRRERRPTSRGWSPARPRPRPSAPGNSLQGSLRSAPCRAQPRPRASRTEPTAPRGRRWRRRRGRSRASREGRRYSFLLRRRRRRWYWCFFFPGLSLLLLLLSSTREGRGRCPGLPPWRAVDRFFVFI